MKFLLTLVVLFLFVGVAQAQTSIAVDLNKATLEWQHTVAPDTGVPDGFNMKCGNVSGQYTKITTVGPTARSMPVKDAITGSGNWFCAVSAYNQFGESALSNEVPFAAGAKPFAPSGLQIRAN